MHVGSVWKCQQNTTDPEGHQAVSSKQLGRQQKIHIQYVNK